jgi:hypothetical protein
MVFFFGVPALQYWAFISLFNIAAGELIPIVRAVM